MILRVQSIFGVHVVERRTARKRDALKQPAAGIQHVDGMLPHVPVVVAASGVGANLVAVRAPTIPRGKGERRRPAIALRIAGLTCEVIARVALRLHDEIRIALGPNVRIELLSRTTCFPTDLPERSGLSERVPV